MDRRRNYLIGLDTETANGIMVDDKLDLSNSLVYDLGWQVCDKWGNVYKQRSFVNRDIFVDYADMMKSSYYAEKIPQYMEDIASGKRILASFYDIRKALLEDIAEYEVKYVFAHNAGFDHRALNNTLRYLTKSKYRYFLPSDITWWDTLKMSKVITSQKGYREFCEENGYMTNHKTPRPRATAEILYRYITGENDFIESHTGLEDVEIETQILAECFRKHKKMQKELFS